MPTNHIVSAILICISFCAISQNQQEHVKKYHVGDDGKLYWQADKPVYLFVSENADGSGAKRLESETTPQYANPFYLDTEGVNYIRSRWAVDPETKKPVSPQREIEFEMYRDGTSPATTVGFESPNRFSNDDVIFYGDDTKTLIGAVDGLSGVNQTLFSLNSEGFKEVPGDLTYPDDGDYILKVYSVDMVGNAENPQIFNFTMDLTDPSTSYSVLGDKSQENLSPRTTIKLQGTDGSAGVQSTFYKIDDNDFQPFNGEISLRNVEEGNHTLTYYSRDNVNNDEEEKAYKFYLDRTAPEVIASVVGDQYQNRGRVFISTRTKVKLAASDNKSGLNKVWFKIDGGQEIPYSEPFEMPRTPGKHTIEYYASDNVNNDFRSLLDESLMGRESLDIDIEAPEIDYSYSGNQYFSRDTAFITSRTDIGLSAEDADSGVKGIGYKINGGKGEEYTGPIRLPEEGTYIIDFYGTDQVNNRNSKEFFFTVDNTGPEIEHILSMESVGSLQLNDRDEPLEVYSKGVKLYLAATDNVVDTDAIYFSINGEAEKLYRQPIVLNTVGIVSYSVRATDKLGNESSTELFEIFLK